MKSKWKHLFIIFCWVSSKLFFLGPGFIFPVIVSIPLICDFLLIIFGCFWPKCWIMRSFRSFLPAFCSFRGVLSVNGWSFPHSNSFRLSRCPFCWLMLVSGGWPRPNAFGWFCLGYLLFLALTSACLLSSLTVFLARGETVGKGWKGLGLPLWSILPDTDWWEWEVDAPQTKRLG